MEFVIYDLNQGYYFLVFTSSWVDILPKQLNTLYLKIGI